MGIKIESLDDNEADNLLDRLLTRRPLKEHLAAKEYRTELTIINEHIEAAQELVAHEGDIYGVTTGIKGFDELTCGLKGGDLVVLAGQTSHGKSLMALNIAYRMAKDHKPILFTTLEMSKARVTARIMSMAARDGVDPYSLPILYQEATALAYNDIGMLVAKAKENDCQLVIIDHLHFFPRGISGNVAMEIGRITKHFKEVAVEHDMPIILISHVNRLNDPRSKPGLNNLKESGYIEQDADSVIFIWRDLSIEGDPSEVEIYIAKSRNDGFPHGRVKNFKQNNWNLDEIRSDPTLNVPKEWL